MSNTKMRETVETRRAAMIEDARSAGFEVDASRSGAVDIFRRRRSGFAASNGKRGIEFGLRVFPSGSAFDIMVDLDCARAIRGVRAQREFLGLVAESKS